MSLPSLIAAWMAFLLTWISLDAWSAVITSGHLRSRCSSPFIFSSVVIVVTPFSFVNTKDITKKRKVQRESGQFAFSFSFLSFFCHFSEREPFSPCFELIQRTERDSGGTYAADTMPVAQIALLEGSFHKESDSPERILNYGVTLLTKRGKCDILKTSPQGGYGGI